MARGATSILHHAKSVRRQPTFSPLDKSRRVFLFAFLSLVALASACAIFYIGTHIQAVNLGYKIGQELQRKEELIEENKRLSLEIARLKSPTRIEAEAKDALGLQLPKTQQVFYLSRWEPDSLTEVAAASPTAAQETAAQAPGKKSGTAKTLAAAPAGETTRPAAKTASLLPAEKKASLSERKPLDEKAASKQPEPRTAGKKAAAEPPQVAKAEAPAKPHAKALALKPAGAAKAPQSAPQETPRNIAQSEKAPAPKKTVASASRTVEEKTGLAQKPEAKLPAKTEPARIAKAETRAAEAPKVKPAPEAERSPRPAEKSATVAKKSEPAKIGGAKPEAKPPAAKSSAKPAPQDTRVAKREGTEVLVAKIVAKDASRDKGAVKPRGATASSYQPKDKVPAVMLDPMP